MGRSRDFIASNPVFTYEQFAASRAPAASNPKTVQALLAYQVAKGYVSRIRRGLYASIPTGSSPDSFVPDPYLIAGLMAPDGVLAYHTALEFHGLAQSAFRRMTIVATTAARRVRFKDFEFVVVRPRSSLVRAKLLALGVNRIELGKSEVRVTSVERTVVDALDRIGLCGGTDEVLRSLDSIRTLYAPQVAAYVAALANRTVAARVGWFLDARREELGIDGESIDRIRELIPRQPVYLDSSDLGPRRLVRRWNLICPDEILSSRGLERA